MSSTRAGHCGPGCCSWPRATVRADGWPRRCFEETDAKADAHCDWLLDPAALSRAGFEKLLRGWHDAAALAAVDSWLLGRYDLVQHSAAITKVDHALAELAQRFLGRYSLLHAACEAAELPPLLYAALPRGTRTDAARLPVNSKSATPPTEPT